jgi:hypothetical protein
MKAAYTRYGLPDVLALLAIQKDSSPARAKSRFRQIALPAPPAKAEVTPKPRSGTRRQYRNGRLSGWRFRQRHGMLNLPQAPFTAALFNGGVCASKW